MKNYEAKPFLKWAGGKSQLLASFENYYPERLVQGRIKTYIEPFVGAGAVFFHLQNRYNFENIILNDINKELILAYKVIQNNVEYLIDTLSGIEQKYLESDEERQQEIYYEIREEFNKQKEQINYDSFEDLWVKNAANMIFLNKTCFNGLYRENKKGGFNVPFGKRTKVTICDKENLVKVNKSLSKVELLTGDFQELTRYITEDTFIYIDPPYRPLSKTSAFTDYSKVPFNDEEQIRLASWTKEINRLKAAFMLSNSDPKNTNEEDNFFDYLYKDFIIERVSASRAINSKGSGRSKIRELLVMNEPPKTDRTSEYVALTEG